MSAIAFFIKLPKSALEGLRDAAIPKKRLFGAPRDTFDEYVRRHGRQVADYHWSGYVFATLLVYLQEQQVDLMRSEHDELSRFLSETRGATVFIFTDAQRISYAAKLDSQFPEQVLRDYYNRFNGTNEPDAGKPMLDGIDALRQSLRQVDETSVILFSIG